MTAIRLAVARPRPPLTTTTEPDTMAIESVTDLAHRLLSTDDTAKASETHRLAAFVVDHSEHLAFGQPSSSTPAPATTELTRRIEPMRPTGDEREG